MTTIYSDSFADDLFNVKDVKISADGTSAAQARETAIANGQVQAFKSVIEQLAPGKAESMPLAAAEVNRLVQSFEVQDEHISAVHYEAVMQISFNPGQSKQFLEQRNIVTSNNVHDKIEGNHQFFAIPVGSPVQWAKIRSHLKEVASVKQISVKEITIQQVVVDITYKGTLDAFGAALQQNGFLVTPRRGFPLLQFIN